MKSIGIKKSWNESINEANQNAAHLWQPFADNWDQLLNDRYSQFSKDHFNNSMLAILPFTKLNDEWTLLTRCGLEFHFKK